MAAALDPRRIQRFRKEAQTAARLNHPHMVPVYFIGCERGIHFYAMRYIQGLSLSAIIDRLGRISRRKPQQNFKNLPTLPEGTHAVETPGFEQQFFASPSAPTDPSPLAALTTEGSTRSPVFFQNVARLGMEAALGLEQTQQAIILHRDIKPANLLVDSRGSLWITDFGLAHINNDSELTRTGELLGTYRYMSPGIIAGAPIRGLPRPGSTTMGCFRCKTPGNTECWSSSAMPGCRAFASRRRSAMKNSLPVNAWSVFIFAQEDGPADSPITYYHCNVAFNDLSSTEEMDPGKPWKGNRVGLLLYQQFPAGQRKHSVDLPDAGDWFLPKRPVGLPGPFRKIAVEVRPENILVFWEEQCIGNIPRKILKGAALTLVGRPNDPKAFVPSFPTRGGLGLFVSLGEASFRNVTLEPLP